MDRLPWFSGKEVKDMLIAVAALSFVFAYPEALANPVFLAFSFFAVGVAFMGHELSHRYVARRLGYWAEFRLWRQGIFFALLMAFATNGGFVFAAPGAVVFASPWGHSRPRKSHIGLIGIAGVAFNLALMYGLLALGLFISNPVIALAAFVNGWLALFNLIPFGPLDGRKVLSWNRVAWSAAIGLSLLGIALNLLF